MTDNRAEGGANARSLTDTIAGTGPGIPDDALAPGQELPDPPSKDEVERIARTLGVSDSGQQIERANPETRQQRGGEAGTTRFGMEDGDNTDVPSTGSDPERQSPTD